MRHPGQRQAETEFPEDREEIRYANYSNEQSSSNIYPATNKKYNHLVGRTRRGLSLKTSCCHFDITVVYTGKRTERSPRLQNRGSPIC